MSKHNRDRRRWRCRQCGAGMWREIGELAAREADRRGDTRQPVHVCGVCKCRHYAAGDGLRVLTPAEPFSLWFTNPRTQAEIDAAPARSSDVPRAELFLGDG